MTLTLKIPKQLEASLGQNPLELERTALEAFAARAYAKQLLTFREVGLLLGFDNRWDTERVLRENNACSPMTIQDVEKDVNTIESLTTSGA